MVTRRSWWRRLTIALLALTIISIALPAPATVSGQNGKIAFVTERDGNPEIYLMDSDGSNLVNLTQNPARDYDPAWSPDGRQIAFVSDRSGEFGVYVMDADGSDVRFIVPGEGPAWSPDGTRIALKSREAIAIVQLQGGEVQLTNPTTDPAPAGYSGLQDADPAWSSDGSRIAFVRAYLGTVPRSHYQQLMVIDVGGSGPPRILPSSDAALLNPDWSPDATRILVTEMGPHALSTQVVVVDADDSTRTLLPALADNHRVLSWSPDGTMLLSSMGTSTTSPEVSKMNLDGSNQVNLTNHPGFDHSPVWQPLNPYPTGLVDPATGIWSLRDREGLVTSFYYGSPGDFPFMGDWDCDGVETPGLYRQSDGYVYLRNSNSQGIADVRFFFGNPGDVPLAGDFDADGCDTISIYRPPETRIYVINQLGTADQGLGEAEYSYLFGNPGDKPFVGDFDGDGIDTVGLHRESTGKVYYRDSNTQGIADNTFVYGNPGDRLIAHDWNGDGMDSPAVFRPVNSTFYFRFTNDDGTANARYIRGGPDWLPVAGDFDN